MDNWRRFGRHCWRHFYRIPGKNPEDRYGSGQKGSVKSDPNVTPPSTPSCSTASKPEPKGKVLLKGTGPLPTSDKTEDDPTPIFRYDKIGLNGNSVGTKDVKCGSHLADSPPELVIGSWESQLRPRHVWLYSENDKRTLIKDKYGKIDAHVLKLDDGWLLNQSEVRLRLLSVSFLKNRFKNRSPRVKVTPVDLRYKEVLDENKECDSFKEQRPFGRKFKESEFHVFKTQTVAPAYLAFRFDFFMIKKKNDEFSDNSSSSTSERKYAKNPPLPPTPSHQSGSIRQHKLSLASEEWEEYRLVGVAHCLPPINQNETRASLTIGITNLKHQPIGQIQVDYLLIRPMEKGIFKGDLSVSFSRYWRKRDHALDVGHRGLGNSYTKAINQSESSRFTMARENTIKSLTAAATHGADFVEFDVQLSKDQIPIVFHDFHVCVSVKKRLGGVNNILALENAAKRNANPESSGSTTGPVSTELYELGVKDLKLSQLQHLKLDHHMAKGEGGNVIESLVSPVSKQLESEESSNRETGIGFKRRGLHVVSEETLSDELENQPFPALRQVLDHVYAEAGFNIEIKSPLMCEDGTWETDHFWERNLYMDRILEVVMNHAGSRRILFSSFDPDICTMLKLKQNRYPCLFLTQGITQRYVPFLDKRANTSQMAVAFAASNNILGVNFHSEELIQDSSPLKSAQKNGLVSFVWGDDLDLKDHVEYFRQLHVDGLIYDRIHDQINQKPNVFLWEKKKHDDPLSSMPIQVPSPSISPLPTFALAKTSSPSSNCYLSDSSSSTSPVNFRPLGYSLSLSGQQQKSSSKKRPPSASK